MQRHLAALEPDLVETTGTGLLTLVAAAGGLAPARTHAATDTVRGALAALRVFKRMSVIPSIIRHALRRRPW